MIAEAGEGDTPRYVVVANIDGVVSGGSSALLVVRDVFGAIYDQPDTSTAISTGVD